MSGPLISKCEAWERLRAKERLRVQGDPPATLHAAEIDAFVERVITAGEVDQLLGSIQRGLLREVPRRQDRIRLHIKTLRARPFGLAVWVIMIGLVILLVRCGWPS